MVAMRMGVMVGLAGVLAAAGCTGAAGQGDVSVVEYSDTALVEAPRAPTAAFAPAEDGEALAPADESDALPPGDAEALAPAGEAESLAPSYGRRPHQCDRLARSHCEKHHAPTYLSVCSIESSYYSPTGACVYSYLVIDSPIGDWGT